MKTTGMKHQLEALQHMNGRTGFALFMEQGTGKTWCLLADAERLYAAGHIDAMLVIAPKGVHTNWVRREIPAHMDADVLARAWRSGAGKKEAKRMEDVLKPRDPGEQPPLRVLAMNIEALCSKAGFAFARRFLMCTRAVLVVDESSRIKNPAAARTLALMKLQPLAAYHRIATGTPITNAPVDVFAQMEFLESGLLGTTSYRSFVAEYADLVDFTDVTSEDYYRNARLLKANPRIAFAQVVARDAEGNPRWRNLEKLQRLLEPHSFRVLKKECLDLPDKIYQQVYFNLDADQAAAYRLMEKDLRFVIEEGQMETVAALAAIIKLQQITSGFIMKPGKEHELVYVSEGNPRLAALEALVEDLPGKIIVWARFKEELRAVAEALRKAGRVVVEFNGSVRDADRETAVDEFQNGVADAFVGQPQSGGIGLTLTAAETVIYFSNDFNSETRKQSEDRAHRIGTTKHVVYIDLTAEGTIDESIIRALQRKADLAATILGDYA